MFEKMNHRALAVRLMIVWVMGVGDVSPALPLLDSSHSSSQPRSFNKERSRGMLRLRGGENTGGNQLLDEERKRTAAPTNSPDSPEEPQGKRPRIAARNGEEDLAKQVAGAGGAEGGLGAEAEKKALVRIPRDLLKRLRAVVKEVPPEGVAVAKFVDRYQELYDESLKATASKLGFSKVTALLSVLPSICNCTFPPATLIGKRPSRKTDYLFLF